jgi:hypothetical protein
VREPIKKKTKRRLEPAVAPPPVVETPPPPLRSERIERADLERRLSRAAERLRARAGQLPRAELDGLERTYFSLRRSLATAPQGELEPLARGISDLERDVRRLLDDAVAP